MADHDFNFEHGEILGRIGASWYASYAYNKYCDPSHDNFMKIGTWKSRVSKYKGYLELEKYFIEHIVTMSPENLEKNKIELSGKEVIRMAKAVLALM